MIEDEDDDEDERLARRWAVVIVTRRPHDPMTPGGR